MKREWIWTDHIEEQIVERELSKEMIEETIDTPDEVVAGKYGRQIYHKLMNGKLIRVVADGNILITVYITDNVKKYWRGKQT